MTIQSLATALTALFFGSYCLLRRTRPRLRRRDFAGAAVAVAPWVLADLRSPHGEVPGDGERPSPGRGVRSGWQVVSITKEETLTPLRKVPLEELPGKVAAKWRSASAYGVDLSFLAVLGSAPHVTDFYYGDFYEGLFFAGTVPVRLKELARLRLAGVHGCVPCQSLDVQSALAHGVSETEIAAVWSPDTALFTEPERSVLELADAMSFASSPESANDELLARLQRHLTDAQIIELAMVCAVLTGAAKMLLTLGLVDRSIRCDIAAGATTDRTEPPGPQSP